MTANMILLGSNSKPWSSTVGVVTAILGNILVSFAFNIQRYAHSI